MSSRRIGSMTLAAAAAAALLATTLLAGGTSAIETDRGAEPLWTEPLSSHPPLPGVSLWEARYDSGDGSDYGQDVAVGPDGATVYVTGYARDPDETQTWLTLAYNALTGVELWSATYAGPGGSFDYGRALDVSPDGTTVYVTGSHRLSTSFTDNEINVVAYDAATGAELWQTPVPGERGQGYDIVAGDEAVFVTGEGAASGTQRYLVAAGLAADDGALLWSTAHGDGARSTLQRGNAIATDGDAVYVTGRTSVASISDFSVAAFDAADGALLWSDAYDYAGSTDYGNDIAVADGVVVSAGRGFWSTFSGGTGTDFITVAHDASSGARQWLATHDHEGTTSDWGEALSTDGTRAYVTGNLRGASVSDQYLGVLAYDLATGDLVWEVAFQQEERRTWGYATSLGGVQGTTLFAAGEAYVEDTCCDRTIVTLAVDTATGSPLWSATSNFGESERNYVDAVAAGPLGVYAVGRSAQPGSFVYDVATAAHLPLV